MSRIFKPEIELHNGVIIPTLGYRIEIEDKNIEDNVLLALKANYRHFDLPVSSEAEKAVGKAIKDSNVDRSDLFLTIKISNDDHGYDRAIRAAENSLKRLGTDYADLVLIDWPNPMKYRENYDQSSYDTWRALETLYKNGTARAIGLANYEARHIEHVLNRSEIAPMYNQARVYPGFPFIDNMDCANEHSIQTEGFLPPDPEPILSSKELTIFAEKYKTTPRNICLAYLLNKGCIALTHAKTEKELNETFEALNIELKEEDIKYLDVMKNYGPENINPDTCDF